MSNINIPASVSAIADYAFEGCEALTNVGLREGLTSIGNFAFAYCNNIGNINIPASLISIGEFAFEARGVSSIVVSAANSVYYSEGNCLIEKATKKLILGGASSVIPDGVTSIGKYAFSGCNIDKAVIPDSVTTIEEGAF